ncbi:hypothetical protein V7P28_10380, partial [Klebsiella michiganensis]
LWVKLLLNALWKKASMTASVLLVDRFGTLVNHFAIRRYPPRTGPMPMKNSTSPVLSNHLKYMKVA